MVTRVLPVARVLRALPFARRLALYEAWKRQWGEQRERLRVLQQQSGAAQDGSVAVQDGGTGALQTPSMKETLSKLAATVQVREVVRPLRTAVRRRCSSCSCAIVCWLFI